MDSKSGLGGWRERFSAIAIGAAVGLLVFAAAALAGLLLYRVGTDALKDQTRQELVGYARLGAQLIDGDLHKTFVAPDQERSSTYAKAIAPLKSLQVAHSDLEYVYTIVQDSGQAKFILDPTPAGDHDGDGQDDKSHIGEVYEDVTPAMAEALRYRRSTAETEPSRDDWGTFISGYAPFFDSNRNPVGVVGVDMSARDYLHRLATLDRALGNCFLLSVLLGACSGLAAGALRVRQSAGRQALRRASIVESQRRVLHLLASSAPLGKLLATVCKEAEALVPGIWCSIWVHRDGGGTYRAVSQTACEAAAVEPSFDREVGSPVVSSDGRTLGRVMLKLPAGMDRMLEVQEVSQIAASLAAVAIEKRNAEEELAKAHAALKASRHQLESEIESYEEEIRSGRRARMDVVSELGFESHWTMAEVVRLIDRLPANESAPLEELRHAVSTYVDKMDNLAELARITTLSTGFVEESPNAAEEVRSLLRPVRETCEKRSTVLEVSIQSALEHVVMRGPTRTRQILTSLLNIVACKGWGGTLRLEARLDFRQGSWLSVDVTATRPHPQGDDEKERLEGVTRLTMEIAHDLVHEMGGTLVTQGEHSLSVRLPLHAGVARLSA